VAATADQTRGVRPSTDPVDRDGGRVVVPETWGVRSARRHPMCDR
jgi:hypothetical protein